MKKFSTSLRYIKEVIEKSIESSKQEEIRLFDIPEDETFSDIIEEDNLMDFIETTETIQLSDLKKMESREVLERVLLILDKELKDLESGVFHDRLRAISKSPFEDFIFGEMQVEEYPQKLFKFLFPSDIFGHHTVGVHLGEMERANLMIIVSKYIHIARKQLEEENKK